MVWKGPAVVVGCGRGDIGDSIPGKLDERAEKNGCSSSLSGELYACGIAGTGGTTSLSSLPPFVSILGLGVGSLDEEAFCENLFGMAGTAFIF
jgi:hypothetical protein